MFVLQSVIAEYQLPCYVYGNVFIGLHVVDPLKVIILNICYTVRLLVLLNLDF